MMLVAARRLRVAGFAALLVAVLWPCVNVAAAAAPLRLLLLGDSLTAGYGLPKEEAFPARLEAALKARGHDVTVIDAGVSGDTTAGGRARLAWVLGGTPGGTVDAAIVELGANDGLRGLPPAEMRANLAAILDEFARRHVPVLLEGMHAMPNLGEAYGREYDAAFAQLAKSHHVLFDTFFLEGVAAKPELNQADGLHPNAKGVAVIVARLVPKVEQLLKRAEARVGVSR
jgi:acyl-CoA thioesterase-1